MIEKFASLEFAAADIPRRRISEEEVNLLRRAHRELSPDEVIVSKQAASRLESNRTFEEWASRDLDADFWRTRGVEDERFQRVDNDIFVRIFSALAGVREERIVTSRCNEGAIVGFKDREVVEYSQRIFKDSICHDGPYEVPEVVQGLTAGLSAHQTLLGDALTTEGSRDAGPGSDFLSHESVFPILPCHFSGDVRHRQLGNRARSATRCAASLGAPFLKAFFSHPLDLASLRYVRDCPGGRLVRPLSKVRFHAPLFCFCFFMIITTNTHAMSLPSFAEFDLRARNGESLTVAFLGGSLTWGAQATDPQKTSYRALISRQLESKYPNAHLTYIDAAIGGTGSQLAAFRLQRDVLAYQPDLVFLDFTVNDDATKEPTDDRLSSYESLVRRMVMANIPVVQVILAAKADTEHTLEVIPLLETDEELRLNSVCIAGGKVKEDSLISDVSESKRANDLNAGNKSNGVEPSKPAYADISYGSHERNLMDVWLASSDRPTPCVIFIHGGGWLNGDKSKGANPAPYLKEGISYIAINYRYLEQTIVDTGSECGTGPIQPRGKYQEPPVRVPLSDAALALQFIRTKATDWNIDPERIGLTGGSAGACTSLWLAFHDDLADPHSENPVLRESTRVRCAAVDGAQTTLDPLQILEWMPNATYGGHAFGYIWDRSDPTVEIRSFFSDRDSVKDWVSEYSPYALLTKNDPPVFLSYNDIPEKGKRQKDPTHSSNYGALLAEKLDALGMTYEFVHGGVESPRFKNAMEFMIHHLRN